jgi:hypothetical protein
MLAYLSKTVRIIISYKDNTNLSPFCKLPRPFFLTRP